jgi:predicted house-cleaning noncanonical NTP pyrophosphatase (MazG superfamily)
MKTMHTANKLVRDKIPEIIKSQGKKCETSILSDSTYKEALLEKLLEEVDEIKEASDKEHKTEEIADLLEVLYTYMDVLDISMEDVEKLRQKKRKKRGGFLKKIFLVRYEK